MQGGGWNPRIGIFLEGGGPLEAPSEGAPVAVDTAELDTGAVETAEVHTSEVDMDAVHTAGVHTAAYSGDVDAPAGALDRVFALRPTRFERRVPGRETFTWRAADGTAVVVKRTRGGPLGERARDLLFELLRGRGPTSPAEREDRNLRALAARGFPVPPAVGWIAERGASLGRGRAALVLGHVAHRESLHARLERAAAPTLARHADPLARLVARLHATGWIHRDLYLEHVILATTEPEPGERLVLLDLGRARRYRRPRRRWLVKDLAALAFSAPATVTPRARLRFLARYLDALGVLGHTARRAFAWAVLRKVRRMAAHAPRHDPPRLLGAARAR